MVKGGDTLDYLDTLRIQVNIGLCNIENTVNIENTSQHLTFVTLRKQSTLTFVTLTFVTLRNTVNIDLCNIEKYEIFNIKSSSFLK